MDSNYTIFPLGDSALTVDFGCLSLENNKRVHALFQRINNAHIAGVKDVIPGYSSLTIVYDPVHILSADKACDSAFDWVQQHIEKNILMLQTTDSDVPLRYIELPVCYHGSVAPDIAFVAHANNISVDDVWRIHVSRSYRVFMIGFLPGFAYMASVDEKIATPRKQKPRKNVPAGSVGIAGEQTGIYPLDSPGGWQLIGMCPVKLFDPSKKEPALLQPGDEVKFLPISLQEYHQQKHS